MNHYDDAGEGNCKCGHARELHIDRTNPGDTRCTVREECILVGGGETHVAACDCLKFEEE